MGTLTNIQYAWAIYFAGALGCTIAAWWMFLWAWRFVRYSAVATVMTLLFTPYAIDPQTMTMAPAIYTLVFEGMSQGFKSVQPLMKLMLGIWIILEIVILVLVVLTRKSSKPHKQDARGHVRSKTRARSSRRYEQAEPPRRDTARGLSREEYQARTELMKGEIPIRAIRD